jgi:hypothetical protein
MFNSRFTAASRRKTLHSLGKILESKQLMSRAAILLGLFMACVSPAATNPPVGSTQSPRTVEIHYLGWDLLTRAALSPSQLKEMTVGNAVSISDRSLIQEVIEHVDPDSLAASESGQCPPGDARLVVELTYAQDDHALFYASKFSIYSEDSCQSRSIDQEFREFFHRLVNQSHE